jgi:hypothetical protein
MIKVLTNTASTVPNTEDTGLSISNLQHHNRTPSEILGKGHISDSSHTLTAINGIYRLADISYLMKSQKSDTEGRLTEGSYSDKEGISVPNSAQRTDEFSRTRTR